LNSNEIVARGRRAFIGATAIVNKINLSVFKGFGKLNGFGVCPSQWTVTYESSQVVSVRHNVTDFDV
jgi:hypothetical protein